MNQTKPDLPKSVLDAIGKLADSVTNLGAEAYRAGFQAGMELTLETVRKELRTYDSESTESTESTSEPSS